MLDLSPFLTDIFTCIFVEVALLTLSSLIWTWRGNKDQYLVKYWKWMVDDNGDNGREEFILYILSITTPQYI